MHVHFNYLSANSALVFTLITLFHPYLTNADRSRADWLDLEGWRNTHWGRIYRLHDAKPHLASSKPKQTFCKLVLKYSLIFWYYADYTNLWNTFWSGRKRRKLDLIWLKFKCKQHQERLILLCWLGCCERIYYIVSQKFYCWRRVLKLKHGHLSPVCWLRPHNCHP